MGSICGTSMVKSLLLISFVIALNITQLAATPVFSTDSESGRHLVETDNFPGPSRHLDDTVRVDPLDRLKKYRGGYDITNKHYWSSTVYTGIPGYTIAALWVLCGLGYGAFLTITTLCCKRAGRKLTKKPPNCHKQCYLQPLLFAIFLTILAIMGCGLALGGNAKFHDRAKTVIDVIIDTADEASETIYKTTEALENMSASLEQVGGNSEATRFLTSTSQRLDSQANDIQTQASNNRHLIKKVLNIAYIVTSVTFSMTLVVVIALLAFGVLKFHRTVQVLVAFCWILTVLCWLFFGVYFFLQNFVGDTCTAIEGFQQDPYNNSLSSILPCDELLSARSVLDDVGSGIYNTVNEVNENISRSYGNIVQICNPFSPPPTHQYQPWNCPSTSIRIGDIPQVMRMLTCPDTQGQTCNGGILVSTTYYNTIEAYSTSLQRLLDVYPGMQSLVECQTVKDTFAQILHKHCNPLKRSVRIVWAGLVFLSVVLVALVLVWTIGAHHDKHHRSSGGSVKPHSADTLECETTNDSTKLPDL